MTETRREIPVAFDVDVAVIGGSCGAVAAASAAARAGASVFLAAPRPYLGEDLCAPMRLWLEAGETPRSELGRALFDVAVQPAAARAVRSAPFTYTADKRSVAPHADSHQTPILSDGVAADPLRGSVQFAEDVALTVDLGRARSLRRARLFAFARPGDYDVGGMTVAASLDGRQWGEAVAAAPEEGAGGAGRNAVTREFAAALAGSARYLRLAVCRAEGCGRLLLGEIAIEAADDDAPAGASVRQPPTPMHVKRTLDQALLDAGVAFLFGCLPTDVLVGDDGRPAGIVMANRAGRQAVRARVVVDATERATVARRAGASFSAYPAGIHEFRRVVVGGQPQPCEAVAVRRLPFRFASGKGVYDAFECVLRLPMADDSFAAFAAAEQQARDLTWRPAQVYESETLFEVPPDAMAARVPLAGEWPGADRADLGAFQPAGVERLFVLGACAGVSRAAAARLIRPLEAIELGARIGAAAAAEARGLAAPRAAARPSRASAPAAGADAAGDVRETLIGIRPTSTGAVFAATGAAALPVLGEYDVVVVGGGTAGAPAAIGAARRGARTLVIEYLTGLGGVSTLGLIGKYYHGNRVGFTTEIDAGVAALGAAVGTIGKAEYYRRAIRGAGGEIWFGALGAGAWVEGGAVRGVVVATPRGRGVVRARVVVDATGHADIAAAAGAETVFVSGEHVAMQGTGLPGVNLGANYTNTDYTFADDADMLDLWRLFVGGREKFAAAFDMGQLVDSRERRRIVGDVTISPLDVIGERAWADTICVSKSDFDSHGYTVHPVFLLRAPHRDGRDLFCRVPYRALIPRGLDGLLVVGLGLSAHRDAIPIVRMQPDIQNHGYAAGVAAAMAARAGGGVRGVDVRALQRHLVEKGIVPEATLTEMDSPPLPKETIAAAVRDAAGSYRTMAVILSQPADSLPLLREAFAKAADDAGRLVYAHVLGMMGDASGADALLAAVRAEAWDKGWNFRGMGQYGGSLSPLDSRIVALGRTRDRRAVPVLLEKLAALGPEAEFSHHRAAAMALETLGDPAAAPALAALLAKPGMTGYALEVERPDRRLREENRNAALRELILARALFRCGDANGIGRRILERYERDAHGLFSRHARAVLTAK